MLGMGLIKVRNFIPLKCFGRKFIIYILEKLNRYYIVLFFILIFLIITPLIKELLVRTKKFEFLICEWRLNLKNLSSFVDPTKPVPIERRLKSRYTLYNFKKNQLEELQGHKVEPVMSNLTSV